MKQLKPWSSTKSGNVQPNEHTRYGIPYSQPDVQIVETLPLELRFEITECLANDRYKLLKLFYNRDTIAERYLNGNILLHVHVLTGENRFCATWRRGDHDGMPHSRQMLVLVGIGQVSENPRPVASNVRLQSLDSCDVLPGQTIKVPVIFPKVLFRIYDNKLCLLYNALGIVASQLINKVVQGDAEVLDDVANEPSRFRRSGSIEGCRERPQYSVCDAAIWERDIGWFALQGDVITYNLPKGFDFGAQTVQVFPCPVDPLISAVQLIHAVYLPELINNAGEP